MAMSPPIRYRGPWRLHKRSAEPDRWLDEMGFFRKHTARDSSCLFRIVSENVYNTQKYFHKVRLDCVQFMAANPQLFDGSLHCPFENYLNGMSNPSELGGVLEISAMSHLYRRDFVIFEPNKTQQNKICNGYEDIIHLYYSPETKHYDAVYPREYINTSSFCQSLIYHILYDGVYKLKDLPYAIDKMLHEKVPTNHVEYFMSENIERRKKQKERAKIYIETTSNDHKYKNINALALKCKHHTQDVERASLLKESLSIFVFNRSLIQLENVCMNCLDVNSAKDLLDNGITPFPYKVAKALDPDIYRNIEFDVWSELRRELRYGPRYSDGTTLQVGVKCLCKLEPGQSAYHCHIQEMRRDGPCLVFVEELGEKRLVNIEQLELLPQEEIRPWAPPYRYSRTNSQIVSLSQMLQQLGSISRKQGLNKRTRTKVSEEMKPPNDVSLAPLVWSDEIENETHDMSQYTDQGNMNFSTYQHMDYLNFAPVPVEVDSLPAMVDCRPTSSSGAPGAAPPPHELHAPHPPAATNGGHSATQENHHNQAAAGAGGELAHGVASPGARASTPAAANALTTYSGGMPPGGMGAPYMSNACAPYMCGVKSVLWCAPHSPPPHAGHAPHAPAHVPPPPPPPVNPHVYKSVQANGADLPMNDIPTLRYYFNLGVDCMWSAYGPPPAPHQPPPPPRHYSPRDVAQDMQQMSLHERGGPAHGAPEHKHKPQDKPQTNNQNKGNGQRPLLGPRFKRGNNQDGNQNNHNHKTHNNNMGGNRGINNRRNSHPDPRPGAPHMGYNNAVGEGECMVEQPLISLPYIPYPPPLYPISYYPMESDPAMMGMMGGMGYVGYDEGVEYGAPLQYYPPPHYPPPHLPHPAHAQPPPAPAQPPPAQANHSHHTEHK